MNWRVIRYYTRRYKTRADLAFWMFAIVVFLAACAAVLIAPFLILLTLIL